MSETGLERIEAELREIRRLLKGQGLVKVVVNFTEAAEMLAVSTKHVSRMVKRGDLSVVDVGGARRIPISEIQRMTAAPEKTLQLAPRRMPRYSAAEAEAELARLKKSRR